MEDKGKTKSFAGTSRDSYPIMARVSKVTEAGNDVKHDATKTLDTRKYDTHSFAGTF